MIKDEMKNKISMALKDPILQQGFEIICKENAQLKCECRRCVYSDSPCILSDYGKDKNGICDHFKDVLDEIAELKKKNLDTQDAVTMQMYTNKANKEIADRQLTKAKEIILRLYNAGRDVLMCRAEEKAYDNLSNTINDKSTEQFLSEVENV